MPLPLPHCISPISVFCTPPPPRYTTDRAHAPHQHHSTISQAAHALTFSTASPTALPMPDSAINAQDLTSRLRCLQQHPTTTSTHEEAPQTLTKSATTSTTTTTTTSSHSLASTHTHAESVCVAPGDFSKPRLHPRRRSRSRSNTDATAPPFKYYGRHANQWLFNDFSVTGAVARGWRRVFCKDEGGGGDWYEGGR